MTFEERAALIADSGGFLAGGSDVELREAAWMTVYRKALIQLREVADEVRLARRGMQGISADFAPDMTKGEVK